jgi:hypothetical protein
MSRGKALFWWNLMVKVLSDSERMVEALKGTIGKRLYYKDPIKKTEESLT